MGCSPCWKRRRRKFALVCIATTVIVFLATSYTVLFVCGSWRSWGKDTALAPAVEAEKRGEGPGRQHRFQQHACRGRRQAPSSYAGNRHHLPPSPAKEF